MTEITWGAAHPAECWRMYVRTPILSFLVTWHRNTRGPNAVLLLVQGVHRPLVGKYVDLEMQRTPTLISGGNLRLERERTQGAVDDFAWSLDIRALTAPIDPLPKQGTLGRLRARLPWAFRWFSYPAVHYSGRILWQGRSWEGEGWGAIHYCWGTFPPRHWLWLHAAHCPARHTFAEVALVQTGLGPWPYPWGTLGYAWVRSQQGERLDIHGVTGRIQVGGLADRLRVYVTPWHGTGSVIYARTHVRVWKKLVPDVVTTLLGDVRVPHVVECAGQGLVEWGNPPLF